MNDQDKRKYQSDLVVETAKRLQVDGNHVAASCLYSIAAAMAVNAEKLLAKNSYKFMSTLLSLDNE